MQHNNADKIYESIYSSYLKAEPFFEKDVPDSIKRSPDLLRDYFCGYDASENIAITGSKGKGSIARMISALMAEECVTGLMISPHVSDYLERISVGGRNISKEDFVRLGSKVLSDVSCIITEEKKGEYISPIGLWALLGMRYFKEAKSRFNVLECGKGAKYDDVNRIPHRYAVIGTVFLEHAKELGSTIEEIAADKACVITPDVCRVYVAPQEKSVMDIICAKAKEMDAKVCCQGRNFVADNIRQDIFGVVTDIKVGQISIKDVRIPMAGRYQAVHAAIALAFFADYMRDKNPEWMPDAKEEGRIRKALNSVRIPGRMEVITEEPLCMIDSCINKKSAEELKATLEESGIKKIAAIICIPDDKDVIGVAETIGEMSEIMIFTKVNHPHYPMNKDCKNELLRWGMNIKNSENIQKAYGAALNYRLPIIVITANTFVDYVKKKLGI